MDNMIEVKVSEIEGSALDWAVAEAVGTEGYKYLDEWGWYEEEKCYGYEDGESRFVGYSPSADWEQGGPMIEKFEVGILRLQDNWEAGFKETSIGYGYKGSTPLLAAMRAIVAAEVGDTVKVPKDLVS